MRKVVQLIVDPLPGFNPTLFILCNDGAMFRKGAGNRDWIRIIDCPQDEPQANDVHQDVEDIGTAAPALPF